MRHALTSGAGNECKTSPAGLPAGAVACVDGLLCSLCAILAPQTEWIARETESHTHTPLFINFFLLLLRPSLAIPSRGLLFSFCDSISSPTSLPTVITIPCSFGVAV